MEIQHISSIINVNNIFDGDYIETKTLYIKLFNEIPSINYMGQIDGEKAHKQFEATYKEYIAKAHHYTRFKNQCKKYVFDRIVYVLKNEVIIEIDECYYEILHNNTDIAFVEALTHLLKRFKQRERREPLEINLIVRDGSGLRLKAMDIKRTKLNLALFYEDTFLDTHNVILKRLQKKNDKGIVLLHGLPGTGKTTYLSYLIGKLKKRVLFLSPSVADDLMNPDFMDILINNPNTIVVIEDAENIIRDRRYSSASSVSNLLNISDGLLSDFLNVQLICTFNNDITMVDSALMRKGRLIATYDFGKLSVEKAQQLSNHLGKKEIITRPMTIAEIANPEEKQYEQKRIG
jgi:hypothetical protein